MRGMGSDAGLANESDRVWGWSWTGAFTREETFSRGKEAQMRTRHEHPDPRSMRNRTGHGLLDEAASEPVSL